MNAELLREHLRSIQRAQRDIDRERNNLQNQEKRVIMEIKRAAKQGQMVSNIILSLLLKRLHSNGILN